MSDYTSYKSPRRNSPFSTPLRNMPPPEGSIRDTTVNIATAFSNANEYTFKKPNSPYRSLSSTNVYISPRPKRTTTYLSQQRSLDEPDFFARSKTLDTLEKNDSILNNILNDNQEEEEDDDDDDSNPFEEEENLANHPEEEERRRSFIQRHASLTERSQRTNSFQSFISDQNPFLYHDNPNGQQQQQQDEIFYDSASFKDRSNIIQSPRIHNSNILSPHLASPVSPLSPSHHYHTNNRATRIATTKKKDNNSNNSNNNNKKILTLAWELIKNALDSIFEFFMFWIFMIFWLIKEIAVVFFTFLFMVISTFLINPLVYLLQALGFQQVQPLTWSYVESIPSHRLVGTILVWVFVLLLAVGNLSLAEKKNIAWYPLSSSHHFPLSMKQWFHDFSFSSLFSTPTITTTYDPSWNNNNNNDQALLKRFATLEKSVNQLIQQVNQHDNANDHKVNSVTYHLKQLQQQLSHLSSSHNEKLDSSLNEQMDKVEKYITSVTSDYQNKLNQWEKKIEDTIEKNNLKQQDHEQHGLYTTTGKISPELLDALHKIFVPKSDYDLNFSQLLQHNQPIMERYVQGMMDNWINDQMRDGKLVTKEDLMESVIHQLMGTWKPFHGSSSSISLNDNDVDDDNKKIGSTYLTKEALAVIRGLIDTSLQHYHQDVLNLPDYALGTRGGRILPGHTSQTFIKGAKGMISKWWLKRTRPQPSPLLAITPDAYVGHCWPMDGDQGSLGIHLAEPIFITSMTIEYPSHNLLNHKMSSAPKEVELWGLKRIQPTFLKKDKQKMKTYDLLKKLSLASSQQQKEQYEKLEQHKDDTTNAIYLGSFTYDIKSSSSSIQTFTLDQHQDILFEGAVLRILSNWGNKDHTCLYRIRIHGNLAN